jgi:hypothetical protein
MHRFQLEEDLRQTKNYEEYAQRLASVGSMPIGFIVALFTLLLNLHRREIPLIAPDDLRSLGAIYIGYTIITVLVAGGFAYYLGVRFHNRNVPAIYHQTWKLRIAPILAAMLIISLLGVAIGLSLIDNAFPSLVLPATQAIFLMGVVSATMAHLIISQMFRMSLRRLLSILFIIMTMGLYYAAVEIASENPLWWEESFSYLGTFDDAGSFLFNLTFIFAGILVLVLHGYFMYDFNILYEKGALSRNGHTLLRITLWALGFLVAGVGLFISGASPLQNTLHNLAAYLMAGIIFGYMVGVRWLIPQLPPNFKFNSLLFVLAMFITGVLMMLGSLNTTQAEINAFFIGGAWLATFVNETDYLARQLAPEAFPDLATQRL